MASLGGQAAPNEFRHPLKYAEPIFGHQYLAVADLAGSDADGRR